MGGCRTAKSSPADTRRHGMGAHAVITVLRNASGWEGWPLPNRTGGRGRSGARESAVDLKVVMGSTLKIMVKSQPLKPPSVPLFGNEVLRCR